MERKYRLRFAVALLITIVIAVLAIVIAVRTNNSELIPIVPIAFIFFLGFCYFGIYCPYQNSRVIIPQAFVDAGINTDTLKTISTTTPLSGFMGPLNAYFFDNAFFYELSNNGITQISLADITEIGRTNVQLSNRRYWFVKCNHNRENLMFRFQHNWTIWNNNFTHFVNYVKRINPNAKVMPFSLWWR